MRELVRARLHSSRTEVLLRGHSWDVADVMAVLDELGVDLEAEPPIVLDDEPGRPVR